MVTDLDRLYRYVSENLRNGGHEGDLEPDRAGGIVAAYRSAKEEHDWASSHLAAMTILRAAHHVANPGLETVLPARVATEVEKIRRWLRSEQKAGR